MESVEVTLPQKEPVAVQANAETIVEVFRTQPVGDESSIDDPFLTPVFLPQPAVV